MKGVVGPFIVDEEEGEDTESEADGNADDVDGRVDAVSGEIADALFSDSY